MPEPLPIKPDIWNALSRKQRPGPTQAVDISLIISGWLASLIPKPRQAPGIQVFRSSTPSGEPSYILHCPTSKSYLELDERNYFLWKLLDGNHTLTDLAMAFASQYGSFPFDRLNGLISALKTHGMLAASVLDQFQLATQCFASRRHQPARGLKHLAATAFQKEYALPDVDRLFGSLYRWGGRLLFTRSIQILFGIVSVIGFGCFLALETTETFDLLAHDGIHGSALLVLIAVSAFVLFCHECAHGLTCKAYDRTPGRAGFMVYFGLPAFFVETTSIWTASRKARIAVSLAGPYANLVIGGLASLITFLAPRSTFTHSLFQMAYIAYLGALLNLNPLLEYDGYYVLMDWLKIPHLRRKSFDFLKHRLAARLKTAGRWSREEKIYTLFGLLATAYTVFIIWFALYVWEKEVILLIKAFQTHEHILETLILTGLTIFAGSALVVSLAARATLYAGAVSRPVWWLRKDRKNVEGKTGV